MDRNDILNEAYHNCMREMYAKAQPEADWDNILEEYQSGKLTRNDHVYDRHYLSMDEFMYIRNKYKEAYNIDTHWKNNIETLEELFKEGGLKDKYIPEQIDEDGFRHPGYRSSEPVLPLNELIEEVIKDSSNEELINSQETKDLANAITNKIFETINNYKRFYRYDREAEAFDCDISLGASPISNPETVKQWWKENYNVDIEIEERIPRLFWYRDAGYTDEDLQYEFSDYGDTWEECYKKLYDEWKEEEKQKEMKALEDLEKLREKFNNQCDCSQICEGGEDCSCKK